MKYIKIFLVIFFLSISVTLADENKSETTSSVSVSDTIKIHPIGDSITRGKEGDAYRHYLKTKLRIESHIEVDFVGLCTHAADVGATWQDNQELFNKLEGDIEHDGWGGLKIHEITDMTKNTRGNPKVTVEQMVSDNPADFILLMIGTNDIISSYLLAEAPTRLDTLIARILRSAGNAHLIVSTIPPTPLPIANGKIQTMNSFTPGIVEAYKQKGKNISFIDINAMMGPDDLLSDAYHPNRQGFEKIGNGFYEAIKPLVTDVKDNETENGVKKGFGLKQNYPNPFNPYTKINFSISKDSSVKLNIYDITGKLVRKLVDKEISAGEMEVEFYAGDLPTGVYFYRLQTQDFMETKKLTLLK